MKTMGFAKAYQEIKRFAFALLNMAAILGMRLSVAFRKREFITRSTGGASASGA
jgi:hypothetical protein